MVRSSYVASVELVARYLFATFEIENDIPVWNALINWAYKFVLFEGGTLILAPVMAHSVVCALYELRTNLPDGSAIEAHGSALARNADYRRRVVGAGAIAPDGSIVSWSSEIFRITTPEYLRAEIEAEVRELCECGNLVGVVLR